ncbi:hypothetical protein BASA81_015066 [Batrachochytrium salamandrivorans]|nr:hypothetical protein BASA81_015066 [Batrachochytrium salamandrivorans]
MSRRLYGTGAASGLVGAGLAWFAYDVRPRFSLAEPQPRPSLQSPLNELHNTYSTRGTLQDLRDHYKIGQKLGSGTFAEVKRGTCLTTQDAVAIKEIDKSKSVAEARESEVKMMERMGDHPNLIKLRNVYESEDMLFLVEDLAEGGELFDMIINTGELSEKEAARFFKESVEAIAHLHRNHIIHLDIKPENLLLRNTKQDDLLHIALADFGLAMEDTTNASEMDVCVGTPAYWAPEMVKRERYGRSVDIWSLGCVLYILLVGIHPFDPSGDSPEAQILARVATADYDKNTKEYQNLSAAAKDLIRHLLDPNKFRRYTCEEILQHPWLTAQAHLSKETLNISKLRGFRILTLIKTGMRDLLHRAEEDLFNSLDHDGNGYLGLTELAEGLRAAGFDVSDAEIEAFMQMADADGDALISRKEFKEIMDIRMENDLMTNASLEDLSVLFKAFDKDEDGYISSEDVVHVVSLLGFNTSSTLLSNEWKEATQSKDGFVNFAEFVQKVRLTENQKRHRNDGVAGSSSILKLRDHRDLLKARHTGE